MIRLYCAKILQALLQKKDKTIFLEYTNNKQTLP